MAHNASDMDFEHYRDMIKNPETEPSPLADFEMQGFCEGA